MDDKAFGTEDSRGFWTPKTPVSYGPAFDWPPRPKALLKWLFGFPGYFLPWNVLYAIAAVLIWQFLTPSLATMKTLSAGWIGLILIRNIVLAIAVYGAWHMWLYVWRKQGTAFKYNRQWPKESPAFRFGNQTYDNMFHTLVSGVPIWTAYEVLLLWAYANGVAPMIDFAGHPIGFVAVFFLVPLIHEVGFLFRPPPVAFSTALRGGAQAASPQCQSGSVVRTVDAPDRTCDLFLHDPAVLPHPIASDPHDQSGFAPRPRTGARTHRL